MSTPRIQATLAGANRHQNVGWVQRSETHQFPNRQQAKRRGHTYARPRMMGYGPVAFTHPTALPTVGASYRSCWRA